MGYIVNLIIFIGNQMQKRADKSVYLIITYKNLHIGFAIMIVIKR